MSSYDPDYDEFAELPATESKQHESIYSNDGAENYQGASDPQDDIYFTNFDDIKKREREEKQRVSNRVPPPLPKPAPRKISTISTNSHTHTQTSLSRGIVLSTQNESLPTPPATPKSPSYAGQSAINSFTRYGGSSRFGSQRNQEYGQNDPDENSPWCSLDCEEICDWMKGRTFKIAAIIVLIIMLLAGLTVMIVYLLGNLNVF